MNLKALLSNKLLPKKLSVSKTFNVHRKDVKVETAYSPIDKVFAFNVKISHPSKPVSFGMLTSRSLDSVECKVFGTSVVSCGLSPKMPQCKGCPLAEEIKA